MEEFKQLEKAYSLAVQLSENRLNKKETGPDKKLSDETNNQN